MSKLYGVATYGYSVLRRRGVLSKTSADRQCLGGTGLK